MAGRMYSLTSRMRALRSALFSQHRHLSVHSGLRSTSRASDWEERYIHCSKVPTRHFQESLPRVPFPTITATCQSYLDALKPLVHKEEYERTEKIVQEFAKKGGVGEALNERLRFKELENKDLSYITRCAWPDMFLGWRTTLVLDLNPCFAMRDDPRTNDQADRATNVIRSFVRFYNALMDGKLEPDIVHRRPHITDTTWFRNFIRFVPKSFSTHVAKMFGATPLEMNHYHQFSTTRRPRKGMDEVLRFNNQKHIVIFCRGHLYMLDAMQSNGLPTPPTLLHSQLLSILSDPRPPPTHPVSYLTTLPRDRWAMVRDQLESIGQNKEVLEKIDSALFTLSLDDHHPQTLEDVAYTMLHNQGANRWFDKPMSPVVTKGAVFGANVEHSRWDGTTMSRIMHEVYEDSVKRPYVPQGSIQPSAAGVEKLEFTLPDNVKSEIEVARREVEDKVKPFEYIQQEYKKYGKKYLKTQKISPDAVAQLAYQIAIYRCHKTTFSTFHLLWMRPYMHGRLEALRPATMASKACAEAFDPSHPADVAEMEEKLREACRVHVDLIKRGLAGQGYDNHLLALKTLATREGTRLPIFEDPSYSKLDRTLLLASTLSPPRVFQHITVVGLCPMFPPDGYGMNYFVKDDRIISEVLSYNTKREFECKKYEAALEKVFDDIYAVLNGKNFKL